MPRASAIRAFGPVSVPASIAPARTHVAPPPAERVAGAGGAGRAAGRQDDRESPRPSRARRRRAGSGGVAGAGRLDDEPVGADRDGGVEERAVHRDMGRDEPDALGGDGRGHVAPGTPAPSDLHAIGAHPPERPVVEALERVQRAGVGLCHVVGRLDRPGEHDDDADCLGAPASAAQRTASRRLAGPSSLGSDAERIAPVTTTGSGRSRSRSQKKAVSSMTSVPCTTTTPSIAGSACARRMASAISNSSSNVKWLAGVRPRSIGTISAIDSRPGVRARISSR